VGQLGEHARSVAGALISSDPAAVGEIDQTAQRQLDDAARGDPLDIDHEPNAAAVMLVGVLI
jgi:hypothetical protein